MLLKGTTDWILEGALGQRKSVLIPLNKELFTIGRNSDCDLSLPSHEISRLHAKIHFQGDRVYIEDCGSTNGTYVNRQRIVELCVIDEGDILHFSSIEFRVRKVFERDLQTIISTNSTLMNGLLDPEQQLPEQFVKCEPEFIDMLNNKRVQPFVQPIINSNEMRVEAYEVLGRGNHPQLPVAPYPLFSLAEKLGYAERLSDLFRQMAIEYSIKNSGQYSVLFLNLHPQEMFKHELTLSLEALRNMVPNLTMILEVHESSVTQIQDMKETLKVFQRLDFKLAYDDFGAGRSRLRELIEIPPDVLKFDMSLIRDIDKSIKKQDLVRSLVGICDQFGIATLAEGIETEEEARICRQIGFDYFQGYLFGKPAPMT